MFIFDPLIQGLEALAQRELEGAERLFLQVINDPYSQDDELSLARKYLEEIRSCQAGNTNLDFDQYKRAVSQNTLAVVAGKKSWADLMTANSTIWVKGNSGAFLTPEEDAIYRSLADALEIQYFADWSRAQDLPGANSSDVFAFKFALLLKENPGLAEYWREMLDQWAREHEYAGTEQTSWADSVNRALAEIGEGL